MEEQPSFLDKIGGRKFLFAVFGVLLSFVLVVVNKITGDEFLKFVELLGSVYIVGNVIKAGVERFTE